MDYTKIDKDLLNELLQKASQSERHRYAYDLRNSEEDTSQRMLNTLLPDTVVPIHRHEDTSETNICIKGRLDVIFYNQQPDGRFEEIQRVALNPSQGFYGVQIPKGAWHTVEVHEPSVIFEGKDGAYASTSTSRASVTAVGELVEPQQPYI